MAKKATKVKLDTNPTKIPWPTDTWGFTRELRKAIQITAAKLKGDADKKKILDETMELAIEFLELTYESGIRERKRMLDKLADKEAKASAPAPKKAPAPVTKTEDDLFDLDEQESA